MEQQEKIIQITGSGDVIFALSSEGKLYVGTLHEKMGFEWRVLPELNIGKMKRVRTSITAGDGEDGGQPIFTPPSDGEIKTATILRDEEPK